jgi:hypothetical protein
MSINDAEDLLRSLLAAATSSRIRDILDEIGDFGSAELDQTFGSFQYSWHAFGDRESNISSIGLGTKPGRSLTERLTNSMDALLEERATSDVALPQSAREAAQQWFGRPVSGPEDGLFNWNYSEHGYDRRISVVLTKSGDEMAATVDVIDDGIGIKPEEFQKTILSLQEGNKIKKKHVIGAFGQGGAATLAFADYTVVVSRHRDNPRVVGFTVIRVLRLSEQYKEDCYGYLCLRAPSGDISVPSCQLENEALDIYLGHEGARGVPVLRKGTLVRHINYKLPKLAGTLAPSPGNLYHYLHGSVFDPLFPFRLIDLRDGEPNNQIVTGSRNRLMNIGPLEGLATPSSSGSYLRHHREMEYFAPHGTQEPRIGVEYWVIFNYKQRKDQPLSLRPQSNELFVQTGHPIVGTLNGQNQGELSAQILKDLQLGMVARHIVVHIDASAADSRVRRELFATNREGFKDGPVLTSLVRHLEKMFSEDEALKEIERELTERLAKRESQATSDDVKRQIVRLLEEAGLKAEAEGPTSEPGEGSERLATRRLRNGPTPGKREPLPTLPFPEVTRFVLVSPKPRLSVHVNDSEVVLVETDADSEFDRRGMVAIRSEPDCLELAAKTQLMGGRIRWRLRPRHTSKAGDLGIVVVTLTKPDGQQLRDSTEFEVLPVVEDTVRKAKGRIPPFEVIAINPTDNPESWAAAWPLLDEEAPSEELAAVAYKPVAAGGRTVVYYSTIFAPFQEQMHKLGLESASLPAMFRANYEVWIGYHAILQAHGRSLTRQRISDDDLSMILEEDRTRVAKMQVKQARATAELMQRALRDRGGDFAWLTEAASTPGNR